MGTPNSAATDPRPTPGTDPAREELLALAEECTARADALLGQLLALDDPAGANTDVDLELVEEARVWLDTAHRLLRDALHQLGSAPGTDGPPTAEAQGRRAEGSA